MSKNKKIVMAVCALFITMAAIPLFATYANSRSAIVTIDGNRVNFPDQEPVMVNNRVLVPVRGVFEHMGFEVTWNYEERIARLVNDDNIVIIPAGMSSFIVNSTIVTPDVPQQMINNRMMLPLRAIAEALGGTAEWDNANRVAQIASPYNSQDQDSEPDTPYNTPEPEEPYPTPTPEPEEPGNTPEPDGNGGPEEGEPYYPDDPYPTPGPDNPYYPDDPGDQDVQRNPELVGRWYLLGIEHYIFEYNGHGRMLENAIRWSTYNGLLIICITPEICYDDCFAPSEWYYELSGEALTLTSALIPGVYFTYTRTPGSGEPYHTPPPTPTPTPSPTPVPPTPSPSPTPPPQGDNPLHRPFFYTRSSIQLPSRRQTEYEREAWIYEYNSNGGPSAFELVVIDLINDAREANGLNRVAISNNMMMAARFYTQTLANLDLPLGSFNGPYGGSIATARSFGVLGSPNETGWLNGNGNGGGLNASAIVSRWMNSPGHRDYILYPGHRYIGFGSHLGGRFDVFHYLLLCPYGTRD